MILGDISDAAVDQPLDHRPHLFNKFRGARLEGRPEAAERCDIFVELPLGRFGHFRDRLVERQVAG